MRQNKIIPSIKAPNQAGIGVYQTDNQPIPAASPPNALCQVKGLMRNKMSEQAKTNSVVKYTANSSEVAVNDWL